MDERIEELAKLLGRDCCTNDERHTPCSTCFYHARQVIELGYSHRQELEEDQLIKFYKQWTGGMEPKTQLINFIRAICSKFKAPDSHQMYIKDDNGVRLLPTADLTKENEVLREQNLAFNAKVKELNPEREIDVVAMAIEIYFMEGINSDPMLKQRAWGICRRKERYLEIAEHLKSTSHLWLKEKEKGK